MDAIFGASAEFPELYGPSACTCGTANNSIAMFLEEADRRGARLDGLSFHSYPLWGNLIDKVSDASALANVAHATDCYLEAGRSHPPTARGGGKRPLKLAMMESNSNAATAANAGQNRFMNGLW